jgi:ribosomal protein L11 methyltransferase
VIRLAVRVRRDQAELVLAELLDLAPGGVEEREDGDVVEYAVYGAPGELPELPALRAAAGDALVEVSATEVADDWDERWKAFHRPVEVGPLRVRPPWEAPRAGTIDVVIDPAQAFGTGAHATTRLCLEMLLELEPGGALVDVGCGSGVLAIAARRLGHEPVWALDVDPHAVQATRRNARANGVEVRVSEAALGRDPLPAAPAVLANLTAGLLRELAAALAPAPPVRAVLSGLRPEEAPDVLAAFEGLGLAEADRREADGWATLLVARR